MEITKILGFKPKNIAYFKTAFTHRSMNLKDDEGNAINYERLEFLGDAMLSAVIASHLYQEVPGGDEGTQQFNQCLSALLGPVCISTEQLEDGVTVRVLEELLDNDLSHRGLDDPLEDRVEVCIHPDELIPILLGQGVVVRVKQFAKVLGTDCT